MIETTKLYYSNIISFLAVHTVTTDSANICFNVCMHKKVRTFKNNETKILIVLKKLVAISHKKYLPCLSCVWKKCVFKVKNVSLVSLHLFYYLSDNIIIIMISSLLYEILFYQMLKISTQKFPGCVF